MRLKKKYESETAPANYDSNNGHYDSQRHKEAAANQKQQVDRSQKRLRSNSPRKFLVTSSNSSSIKENPMDAYRLKMMKKSINKKSIDSKEMAKRIEEVKEFANEQAKTHIPRPSINFHQSRKEYRADNDAAQTEIKKVRVKANNALVDLNKCAIYIFVIWY